jgi:hypothetical protein
MVWNQPNLSHLQIFGRKVHVLIHKKKYKLHTRFIKFIFLGYSEESKAYQFMTTSSKNILMSKDVILYELHLKTINDVIQQHDEKEFFFLEASILKSNMITITNQ